MIKIVFVYFLRCSLFRIFYLFLISLFLFPISQNSFADNKITYVVVSCYDGDTCRLRASDNLNVKVRLIGIDAPEVASIKSKKGQEFSEKSKQFINSYIRGKVVNLKNYSQDHYGRNLAEIFLNGVNVNLKMVKEGMAEVYRGKVDKDFNIEPYLKAEENAKKLKIGIWSLKNYQSPSDWRRSGKN